MVSSAFCVRTDIKIDISISIRHMTTKFGKQVHHRTEVVSSAFCVRNDIKIDISISIRPMSTKFGKQVHLEKLTQMRLLKQVMVTSLRQDHVTY